MNKDWWSSSPRYFGKLAFDFHVRLKIWGLGITHVWDSRWVLTRFYIGPFSLRVTLYRRYEVKP